MNIDLEKAKKEFIKYTSNYDLRNDNISRKVGHSIRVMEISKQIATKIGLNKEDIELATLIGLLHDIARFEQYKQYQTFSDLNSIDHGDYGVEILNKDIRKYIEVDKYDEIIKKAIKNHNKLEIEKGLTEKEILFSKIIRDADKLDIIYESIDIFYKNEEDKINKSVLSENVYEQFKSENVIKRKKEIKLENIDNIISVIAFIFDINFNESFEIIYKNDYINKIFNRYNFEDKQTKEKVDDIRKIANEYVKQKAKKSKTSIDILKAKQVFKNYIKSYNPENEKVKIKIAHIERVSQIAKKLAEQLNLDEEDIELSELIGLLHDIGRFEQIRVYNTFLDKDSVNHAEYGVKVLFEDGLIREFLKDNKYDDIIKLAILNHNKIEIEDGLSEKEKLHAKIIRDADKTDIFYVLTIGDKKAIWNNSNLSDEKMSDEVYKDFVENKIVSYQKVKTGVDLLAAHFTYIFDLYFKQTVKIIYDNNYLEKLYNRFKFNDNQTKERISEIYKITKEYIEQKKDD